MPSLRPHHHESLVGGHPEKPGGEARVTPKRADPADDLHQRGLHEVPPILFGERVAQELLFDVWLERRHEAAQRGRVAERRLFEGRLFDGEGHGRFRRLGECGRRQVSERQTRETIGHRAPSLERRGSTAQLRRACRGRGRGIILVFRAVRCWIGDRWRRRGQRHEVDPAAPMWS